MHMLSRQLIGLFFVLTVSSIVVSPALAQEAVIARVGSVPITAFDVGRQLQKLIPLQGSYHSGVKPEKIVELRTQALDELIEQSYLVQYAYSEEIAVSKSDIDAMVKPLRARFKTDDAFQAALGQESEKEFRAAVARHLLAKKALKVAVDDKVEIDETALKADFEKNREKYMRPRQFRASHILIKVDPASSAEEKRAKKDLAQALYEKAVAGEDFHDLAYYNSNDKTAMVGGDVGYFHLGQMDKDVEAVVVKMKVGEISAPISTLYGYEIVKLVDTKPATQLSFDDMREKLVARERKAQAEKLKADLLQSLRAKYPVEHLSSP
jgi:parvulin-like peptidyl-prolyl isomerase